MLALAIGLVLVVEGLAFALFPARLEQALDQLRRIPPERLRLLGLAALAAGVLLIWLARSSGI
ncbi:MAG: DUF2065 family protein [Tranquillimonas sp.]